MSGSIDTEPSAGNSSTNNRPEIPESWLELTLGEVIDYGKTVKAEPSEIPTDAWVLELEDIEKDTSQLLQRLTFAERQSKSTKNRFAAGDVPYGKLRPYLNKVLIANQDGYCTTEIIPLKPNLAINERYLFYWLKHSEFLSYVESVSHGIQMPRLGTEAGLKAPLILAPVNEQRRIVAKLDSLFARSRRAREELERIPKLYDRYKQAVLAAACSGRLTADWREQNPILETASELMKRVFELRKNEQQEECSLTKEGSQKKLELKIFEINVDPDKYALNELPSSWIWSCIDNLGRVRGGKRLPKGVSLSNDDTGFIYIRAGDLKNGTVLTDDLRFVPEDIQPLIKNYTVSAGDIYITIVGACIGDSGIIPAHLNGANLTENAAKISNLLGCSNYYLSIWLRSPMAQKLIQANILSATQGKLALFRIKSLPVPLPPLAEQKEIVQQVETLFESIDPMVQEYQKASKLCDRLEQATLAKAFRGELLPQDPNDEPAAALLERLQAENPTQTKGKSVKSKQRSGGQS